MNYGSRSNPAPATWNRHAATLRSFSGFRIPRGWIDAPIADGLERRREPVDRTKAIPYAQLDRLWRRDDVAVREKALWRLLYETAARAQEVLTLNLEDVDLENKRARAVRCSSPTGGWRPRERQPPPICARIPAEGGCPTAAPKSCSSPLQAGGPCTSSGTPRSRT